MALPDLKLGAFEQWARLEARVTTSPATARTLGARSSLARRLVAVVAKVVLFALLPFFVLVRASVFFYSHYRYPSWLALAVGAGCTAIIVAGYAAWLSHRLTGRARLLALARGVALPFVLAYCGYTLVYLSSLNAKSERVRAYYSSLHPLLRVALSTWMLVDNDIVITDLARRPDDYVGMGLTVYDGSLHYVQQDGYAHAADLRTIGRGVVKSRLVQLYFWGMGFDTQRHAGTADHLHVELPRP